MKIQRCTTHSCEKDATVNRQKVNNSFKRIVLSSRSFLWLKWYTLKIIIIQIKSILLM